MTLKPAWRRKCEYCVPRLLVFFAVSACGGPLPQQTVAPSPVLSGLTILVADIAGDETQNVKNQIISRLVALKQRNIKLTVVDASTVSFQVSDGNFKMEIFVESSDFTKLPTDGFILGGDAEGPEPWLLLLSLGSDKTVLRFPVAHLEDIIMLSVGTQSSGWAQNTKQRSRVVGLLNRISKELGEWDAHTFGSTILWISKHWFKLSLENDDPHENNQAIDGLKRALQANKLSPEKRMVIQTFLTVAQFGLLSSTQDTEITKSIIADLRVALKTLEQGTSEEMRAVFELALGSALVHLGIFTQELNHLQEAIDLLETVEKRLKVVGETDLLAEVPIVLELARGMYASATSDHQQMKRSLSKLRPFLRDSSKTQSELIELRVAVGLILALFGHETGSLSELTEGAELLHSALPYISYEKSPQTWVAVQLALALSFDMLGKTQSVLAYRDALRGFSPETQPIQWAFLQLRLGQLSVSNKSSKSARLTVLHNTVRAIKILISSQEMTETQIALLHMEQGRFYKEIGELTGSTEVLEKAVDAYKSTADVYTKKNYPARWAMSQSQLGTLFHMIGEKTGDARALSKAEQAYRAALTWYTKGAHPEEWAQLQKSLVAVSLAWSQGKDERTVPTDAVASARATLAVYTREKDAIQWARAQSLLCLALTGVAEKTYRIDYAEQARRACRSALQVLSREEHPADWGAAQQRLGIALVILGEWTSDSAVLEEAALAFRMVLSVATRDQHPIVWATNQANLSGALSYLALLSSNDTHAVEALRSGQAALEVFTDKKSIRWAEVQHNLCVAVTIRARRSKDMLDEALAYCRAALSVRSFVQAPQRLARTQTLLSLLYSMKWFATNNPEFKKRAARSRKAVQKVLNRHKNPVEWTKMTTLHALGLVMLEDSVGKGAYLKEALSLLRAVVIVYQRRKMTSAWAGTQLLIIQALTNLSETLREPQYLKEAMATCHIIIKRLSPEQRPLLWALAQLQLGDIQYSMAEQNRHGAHYDDAVRSWRLAAKTVERGDHPLAWADLHIHIGDKLLGRSEYKAEAIGSYRKALKVYTRQRDPNKWGTLQLQMGLLLLRDGEITEARKSVLLAMKVVKREKSPAKWRLAQLLLGTIMAMELEGRAALQEPVSSYEPQLENALTTLRAAVKNLSFEEHPLVWATAQNSIITMLTLKGKVTRASELLRVAVAEADRTLSILTPDRNFEVWALVQFRRGAAFTALGELEPGTDSLMEAIASYRVVINRLGPRMNTMLGVAVTQGLAQASTILAKRTRIQQHLEEAIIINVVAIATAHEQKSPFGVVNNILELGTLAFASFEESGDLHILCGAMNIHVTFWHLWASRGAPSAELSEHLVSLLRQELHALRKADLHITACPWISAEAWSLLDMRLHQGNALRQFTFSRPLAQVLSLEDTRTANKVVRPQLSRPQHDNSKRVCSQYGWLCPGRRTASQEVVGLRPVWRIQW